MLKKGLRYDVYYGGHLHIGTMTIKRFNKFIKEGTLLITTKEHGKGGKILWRKRISIDDCAFCPVNTIPTW